MRERVKNDINTRGILDEIVSVEKRLEIYLKIEEEISERLVRLNHNNDVQNDIMIPEMEEQLKEIKEKQEKVIFQRRIDGLLEQEQENNMAFGSNHLALIMVRRKIEEVEKEIAA